MYTWRLPKHSSLLQEQLSPKQENVVILWRSSSVRSSYNKSSKVCDTVLLSQRRFSTDRSEINPKVQTCDLGPPRSRTLSVAKHAFYKYSRTLLMWTTVGRTKSVHSEVSILVKLAVASGSLSIGTSIGWRLQPTRDSRVFGSPLLMSSRHLILEPTGRWHATILYTCSLQDSILCYPPQ